MSIILPESVIIQVQKILKSNPNFLRDLVKNRLQKHFSDNWIQIDFEKVWEKGDASTNQIPLSPPYKIWDKAGLGTKIEENTRNI